MVYTKERNVSLKTFDPAPLILTRLSLTHTLLPAALSYTNWKVNVCVLLLKQCLNINPGQGSLAVKTIQNLTEILSSRSAFPLALVMSDPFKFILPLLNWKGSISTKPEVKKSVVCISNSSVLLMVISWRLTIKILLYHKIVMLSRNWPHTICIDYFLKKKWVVNLLWWFERKWPSKQVVLLGGVALLV